MGTAHTHRDDRFPCGVDDRGLEIENISTEPARVEEDRAMNVQDRDGTGAADEPNLLTDRHALVAPVAEKRIRCKPERRVCSLKQRWAARRCPSDRLIVDDVVEWLWWRRDRVGIVPGQNDTSGDMTLAATSPANSSSMRRRSGANR